MISTKEKKQLIKEIKKNLERKKEYFLNTKTQLEESNTDKYFKEKIIENLNGTLDYEFLKYNSKSHGEISPKPDLIVQKNGEIDTIELKSSKGERDIPGSSIQQINPFEITIFWNKKTNEFNVGFYWEFITSKMPFHDRSPRPLLSFSEINEPKEKDIILEKLVDWKRKLAVEWIENLTKKNTKWFDESISYFTLYLLELQEEEKKELIKILKKKLKDKLS